MHNPLNHKLGKLYIACKLTHTVLFFLSSYIMYYIYPPFAASITDDMPFYLLDGFRFLVYVGIYFAAYTASNLAIKALDPLTEETPVLDKLYKIVNIALPTVCIVFLLIGNSIR